MSLAIAAPTAPVSVRSKQGQRGSSSVAARRGIVICRLARVESAAAPRGSQWVAAKGPGRARIVCHADPDDEEYDKEGGLLESEAVASGIAVAGVSALVGAVVVLLYLASPVINTTIEAFPSASNSAQQVEED
eukprot:jgi/Tetstr1/442721/TSEL_030811.t1